MLATIALLLVGPVHVAQGPPRMIDGIAKFAGTDRPAARVTLHPFVLDDPDYTVLTDDEGRFRCPEPTQISLPRNDGRPGPPCWAEAEGSGRWRWEPIAFPPHGPPSPNLRKGALVNSSRSPSTWNGEGPAPTPACGWHARRPARSTSWCEAPTVLRWSTGRCRSSRTGAFGLRFLGRTGATADSISDSSRVFRQLQVVVPGEGFSSIGTLEVAEGTPARAETPPLIRFGSIEGRVTLTPGKPGLEVVLEDQAGPRATCDERGRFELLDVRPGQHRLGVMRGLQSIAADQTLVWVAPGGKVDGVEIGPRPPIQDRGPQQMGQQRTASGDGVGGKPADIVWLEGTIRDGAGRGLAGARVFARSSYDGGFLRDGGCPLDDRGRPGAGTRSEGRPGDSSGRCRSWRPPRATRRPWQPLRPGAGPTTLRPSST